VEKLSGLPRHRPRALDHDGGTPMTAVHVEHIVGDTSLRILVILDEVLSVIVLTGKHDSDRGHRCVYLLLVSLSINIITPYYLNVNDKVTTFWNTRVDF